MSFDFFSADYGRWRGKLAVLRADLVMLPARRPLSQLMKSIISGRTLDAVSQAAFERLRARFGSAARLADAKLAHVHCVIADVTSAENKAGYLVDTLQRLRSSKFGFDLDALGKQPLATSLAFLETLPGVGRKVSASTLNASTLGMPVMIVDTHVLRVLRRLGAVGPAADYCAASEAVTAAMPDWRGSDFLDFHVAIKRLGQVLCRPENPKCSGCPLASDCPSAPTSCL